MARGTAAPARRAVDLHRRQDRHQRRVQRRLVRRLQQRRHHRGLGRLRQRQGQAHARQRPGRLAGSRCRSSTRSCRRSGQQYAPQTRAGRPVARGGAPSGRAADRPALGAAARGPQPQRLHGAVPARRERPHHRDAVPAGVARPRVLGRRREQPGLGFQPPWFFGGGNPWSGRDYDGTPLSSQRRPPRRLAARQPTQRYLQGAAAAHAQPRRATAPGCASAAGRSRLYLSAAARVFDTQSDLLQLNRGRR